MTARSRAPFYVFVFLLIAAGISIATWRHLELGIPWMTGEQRPVWMIEARVDPPPPMQPCGRQRVGWGRGRDAAGQGAVLLHPPVR